VNGGPSFVGSDSQRGEKATIGNNPVLARSPRCAYSFAMRLQRSEQSVITLSLGPHR